MIPLINRASHCGFNGGIIEKSSGHFLIALVTEGQFLALQMVKLSSLHDEGRPADVFYHHRRDTLVNALPMVVISLILAFHNIGTFFRRGCLAGNNSILVHMHIRYRTHAMR
jgi:hypothetical protein